MKITVILVKKIKITDFKKAKEIELVLFILMFLGLMSLNLWLFWTAFWLLLYLNIKKVIKILSKLELLF